MSTWSYLGAWRICASSNRLVVCHDATKMQVPNKVRREPWVLALEGEGELVHRLLKHLRPDRGALVTRDYKRVLSRKNSSHPGDGRQRNTAGVEE